jgi:hypothetical protein
LGKNKGTAKGQKQENRPPKEKKLSKANLFYKDTVSSLEKKYQLAMRMKNYDEARTAHQELQKAYAEYRNLLHRSEFVKV